MLYSKNDSQSYISTFRRKFDNFSVKAPLLISFTTSANGVQVINEDKDDVYEFKWDFSIPVKNFIYGIKMKLIQDGCYPIMVKVTKTEVPISKDEQVKMAMDGININDIPTKKIIENKESWMIDKVISFKDRFVVEELNTGDKFLYQLDKSCIFFLQKMKRNQLNQVEAANYFFLHASLLNKIILKEDVDA